MLGTCDTKRGVQGLRALVMLSVLAASVIALIVAVLAGGPGV